MSKSLFTYIENEDLEGVLRCLEMEGENKILSDQEYEWLSIINNNIWEALLIHYQKSKKAVGLKKVLKNTWGAVAWPGLRIQKRMQILKNLELWDEGWSALEEAFEEQLERRKMMTEQLTDSDCVKSQEMERLRVAWIHNFIKSMDVENEKETERENRVERWIVMLQETMTLYNWNEEWIDALLTMKRSIFSEEKMNEIERGLLEIGRLNNENLRNKWIAFKEKTILKDELNKRQEAVNKKENDGLKRI